MPNLYNSNPKEFHRLLKTRKCSSCNFTNLLLTYYKYTLNSTDVSISVAHPFPEDLKRFNGTRIDNITIEHPITNIEGKYLKEVRAHCTNCGWNKLLISKGPLNPNSIGYSPNAIEDSYYNIPRDKCLALTTKGVGCKASIAKDLHLCHKHNTEKHIKYVTSWFKRRGLSIDLT